MQRGWTSSSATTNQTAREARREWRRGARPFQRNTSCIHKAGECSGVSSISPCTAELQMGVAGVSPHSIVAGIHVSLCPVGCPSGSSALEYSSYFAGLRTAPPADLVARDGSTPADLVAWQSMIDDGVILLPFSLLDWPQRNIIERVSRPGWCGSELWSAMYVGS